MNWMSIWVLNIWNWALSKTFDISHFAFSEYKTENKNKFDKKLSIWFLKKGILCYVLEMSKCKKIFNIFRYIFST